MSLFSRLVKAPVDFVESKVDEVRGEVRTEIAEGLASASVYMLLGIMALFSLFFLSVALAIAIAIWTGYYYLGFIVIGVVYAIAGWMVWRMSRNEAYMEQLRAKFRVILKVDSVKSPKSPKEADFAAFENDL